MKDIFSQPIHFQWDHGNIDKNYIKHHVQNWECEQIFFNQPIVIYDQDHSYIEKRWAAFGITDNGRLLVLIFTIRQQAIRVISARPMNKNERKFYEKSKKGSSF